MLKITAVNHCLSQNVADPSFGLTQRSHWLGWRTADRQAPSAFLRDVIAPEPPDLDCLQDIYCTLHIRDRLAWSFQIRVN